MSANTHRLHERLIQVLALDRAEAFNEDTARAAIVSGCIQGAMCDRESVGGKSLNFQRYFEAVFKVGLDGRPLKVKKA